MGITAAKKKRVGSNQQWKCKKCNSLLTYTYETDHIIPKRDGGSDDISNLQALCPNCHAEKTITEASKPRKKSTPKKKKPSPIDYTYQERRMGFGAHPEAKNQETLAQTIYRRTFLEDSD